MDNLITEEKLEKYFKLTTKALGKIKKKMCLLTHVFLRFFTVIVRYFIRIPSK